MDEFALLNLLKIMGLDQPAQRWKKYLESQEDMPLFDIRDNYEHPLQVLKVQMKGLVLALPHELNKYDLRARAGQWANVI